MVCVTQPIHTQPDDDRGLSTAMDEGTLLEIKDLKTYFLLDEGVDAGSDVFVRAAHAEGPDAAALRSGG